MKLKISNLLPWGAIFLTALSLFANGYPVLVQYSAICVSSIVGIGWLISESGWLGGLIIKRFFPVRLSKDQQNRLAVFLDEINNYLSYSYAYSPFYVWHSCSNNNNNQDIRMDYEHHAAVLTFVLDVKRQIEQAGLNCVFFVPSLSKAISEATKLGEKAERDIQHLLKNCNLSDSEKLQLRKDWDKLKNNFNSWINSFSALCKEINKSTGTNSVDYFRPLEIVE